MGDACVFILLALSFACVLERRFELSQFELADAIVGAAVAFFFIIFFLYCTFRVHFPLISTIHFFLFLLVASFRAARRAPFFWAHTLSFDALWYDLANVFLLTKVSILVVHIYIFIYIILSLTLFYDALEIFAKQTSPKAGFLRL